MNLTSVLAFHRNTTYAMAEKFAASRSSLMILSFIALIIGSSVVLSRWTSGMEKHCPSECCNSCPEHTKLLD